MAGKLRVATEQDKAPKPDSLKAAADCSERDLLVKMRDDISDAIKEGVPAHTLAPLMRQLREIDKEIRTLDARAEQEEQTLANGDVDCTYNSSAI